MEHRRALCRQKDSVALAGKQHRNGDFLVGLMQILHGSSQIQNALLMLSQPVQTLLFRKFELIWVRYSVRSIFLLA